MGRLAPAEFTESLALALGVEPSQYALGRSMIFCRLGAAAALLALDDIDNDAALRQVGLHPLTMLQPLTVLHPLTCYTRYRANPLPCHTPNHSTNTPLTVLHPLTVRQTLRESITAFAKRSAARKYAARPADPSFHHRPIRWNRPSTLPSIRHDMHMRCVPGASSAACATMSNQP